MTSNPIVKRRLTRNDWLALAMDIISKKGHAKLNIDDLCRKLGVTKGSFYAHFEGRADFVQQFVAYWAAEFTQIAVSTIDQLADQSAEARLLAIMRMIHTKRLARYDVAVRAWAAQDSTVAKGVEEVDRIRFGYIRAIFHDMGFRGPDLDLRTRLFVVYYSSIEANRLPATKLDADEEIRLRHAFFTRI